MLALLQLYKTLYSGRGRAGFEVVRGERQESKKIVLGDGKLIVESMEELALKNTYVALVEDTGMLSPVDVPPCRVVEVL